MKRYNAIEKYEKYLLRKYNIEYDLKNKIVIIKGPVLVDEFIYLKRRFKEMEIKDIRVE